MVIEQDLIAPLLGGAITATVGLIGLLFRWLSSSFRKVEDGLTVLKNFAEQRTDMTEKLLNDHEDKDQHRHEENLHRFERISVSLARLGSPNGTYKTSKEEQNTDASY